ncbi:MAG TPA: lysophospholipid acyltransferase family protein [Candidatus Dormibacteraeota bacterium]
MRYRFLTWVMRTLVRTVLFGGLFKAYGKKNVPRKGPLIICPNHAGSVDPPLVPAYTPRKDVWSMAKSEYFKNPKISWWFIWYNAFPVVRHSADRAALRKCFDLLNAGRSLLIYPEGTRTPEGVLVKPEPGAGFIAQKAGCPVVPVALVGTRTILPKGTKWPHRNRVSMTFGKPFRVETKRPDGTRIGHQEASDAIMLHIAELLPPEMRGAFADLEAERKRLEGVTTPL